MRVPVEKDDYIYNIIRLVAGAQFHPSIYGHKDYNELPDIIKLEIREIRRYVEFPKGEEFCIHCKNQIEIGDWYRSPCLCYNCQITPEKPPKEFRKAQLRKWKKDKKKALELEKEYIKKLDKNYHLKTKLVRINSLGNRLGLLSGNPRYNRYTSLWIMLAIFILLVILSRISP